MTEKIIYGVTREEVLPMLEDYIELPDNDKVVSEIFSLYFKQLPSILSGDTDTLSVLDSIIQKQEIHLAEIMLPYHFVTVYSDKFDRLYAESEDYLSCFKADSLSELPIESVYTDFTKNLSGKEKYAGLVEFEDLLKGKSSSGIAISVFKDVGKERYMIMVY